MIKHWSRTTNNIGCTINIIMIFTTIINATQAIASLTEAEQVSVQSRDVREAVLISEDCWQLYPYTYSKCLKICSPHLDATCLDDQLCYCNFTMDSFDSNKNNLIEKQGHIDENAGIILPYLNIKFGAHSLASCHFSDFCEELCQNDEKLALLYPGKTTYGALCKIYDFVPDNDSFDDDVESCVCAIKS